MIKKKIDINNDDAFKAACEDNNIILTAKGMNIKPVSYIDLEGKERELDDNFSTNNIVKEIVEFYVGDTVKVYGKIKEGNRERIQVFKGIVIKKQGESNRETFTVRKLSNGVGVEKTWSLHSPNIEKVEVVRRGKVRREKLNYLRSRVGKRVKVKEIGK